MSTTQASQHRAVFDSIDTNKNGSLSADELQEACRALNGKVLSAKEASAMISEHDADNDGAIDFDVRPLKTGVVFVLSPFCVLSPVAQVVKKLCR